MKNKKEQKKNRLGVSTFIATLLLLLIVIVAGAMTYSYVQNIVLQGTQGSANGFTGSLSLEGYSFTNLNDPVLYLQNTGTTNITINQVYYDGQWISNSQIPVTIGQEEAFAQGLTSPARSGTIHTFTIVDTAGQSFKFTVIAGQNN